MTSPLGTRVGLWPTLVLMCCLSMVVLLAGCASVPINASDPPSAAGNPPPPPQTAESITVSVAPATMSVEAGQTQAFSATVNNDTKSQGVTWGLSGPGCNGAACGALSGTSSASGAAITYTAPAAIPKPASVTLTATSVTDKSKSSGATITVTAGPNALSVSISPSSATVITSASQKFTATVQNDAQNKGVTWTLSGAGCGGASCGTLSSASSASGTAITYNAPSKIPNPSSVTVTATSVSDNNVAAAVTITITGPPIAVSVSPKSWTTLVNSTHKFTATVKNDTQNQGVTWALSGDGCSGAACGSLSNTSSASGSAISYTAPATAPTPGTVTLTATSVTDATQSASASITVLGSSGDLKVSISPRRGGLTVTQSWKFTASVQSDPTNQGVTWTASDGTFTNTTSTSAVYHAPGNAGSVTVTATSVFDVTKSASATIGVTALPGVTTYHNSNSRSGVNAQEYALTKSNVDSSTFGKLFSCAVNGQVYPQPLWVANLNIKGGTHNVVFAATEENWVYAFDADTSPCVTYWSKHLVPGGEQPPTNTDVDSDDIQPVWGIVGTPVIDADKQILYLVTYTKTSGTTCSAPGSCHQRLHALRLQDGGETSNGPVEITSSITVQGTGDGSSGGQMPFSPWRENQRPGLALGNGTVYVSWGSHEDSKPWHGWIMGFDGSNLQNAPRAYNTTPNGEGGGIWMSGGAPAIDDNGSLYVITGNGDYDGNSDFGDSFLKLGPNLSLQDWMTPADQASMETNNWDLGAGGAAILVDLPASAPVRHLVIGGGKMGSGNDGELYLLNRDAMGNLEGTGPNIVQKFPVGAWLYATPAFWNNTLFIAGRGGTMAAYTLDPNAAQFNTTASTRSHTTYQGRGTTPAISSNGNSQGILWAIDAGAYGLIGSTGTGPAVLYAYDATNLARELWSSAQSGNRDQAGNAVKFTVPTIANGKVYIGTTSEIDVYGLLP